MKYLHLILLFFVLSCSEKANVSEDFSESKVIKLDPVKKPIVVGNKKYEGPDKIMYIFEGRKHGDIDLSNLLGLEYILQILMKELLRK